MLPEGREVAIVRILVEELYTGAIADAGSSDASSHAIAA